MPTSMKISVLEEDIKTGESGDMFHCALAIAAQRDLGDSEAHIFEDDYQLRIEAHSRSIVLPRAVADFVREFDDGGHVEPITFDLPYFSDEWDESCNNCGHWFSADELDEDYYCPDCRGPEAAPEPKE